MYEVPGGKESDSDDSVDFDSIFTVSKSQASDLVKNKRNPDYLSGKLPDKLPCSATGNIPACLSPGHEKRSRVECPSRESESPVIVLSDDDSPQPVRGRRKGRGRGSSKASPIVVIDDTLEQPTRGRYAGRGRGRRQPIRESNRGKGGFSVPFLEPNIPAPEFVQSTVKNLDWSLDTSLNDVSIDPEEENYEISVKVCWKSKTVNTFHIRKYQKLSSIFDFYAKLEGVTQNQMQLTLGDRIVSPDDSPDSLSLTIANILEGGIITSTSGNVSAATTARAASPIDKNSIQLKVRREGSKEPVLLRIKKNQKMLVLFTKYAEKFEVPLEKLKFCFDGDKVNPSETPEDLDLEGDEMIELIVAD